MGPLLELVSKIVFFSILANMVIGGVQKISSKEKKDGKVSGIDG